MWYIFMKVNKLHLLYVEGIHDQKIIHYLQIILDICYFPSQRLFDQYFSFYLSQLLLIDVSLVVYSCLSC